MYYAMQQLVVRVSDAQKHYLEQEAVRRQLTVSELTRQALDAFFEKELLSEKNFLLELAETAQGQTGPQDLSQSYKKTLYSK